MAQTLDAVTRRTASMGGIRSVVHTMKTLSAINAAPYERAARAIEAFQATVLDGLQGFMQATGQTEFADPRIGTRVIVVFGSDHGLCGNYNETVAQQVRQWRDDGGFGDGLVLCIGAQMADALGDLGIDVHARFLPPANVDGLGRLATSVTERLDAIRQGRQSQGISGALEVSLGYVARTGDAGQTPGVTRLLPIDQAVVADLAARPWASRTLPSHAMPAPDLLLALIRGHLFAGLFRAAAEALVTENAARFALMQRAEQSVDDKLEALRATGRDLRQSQITAELLDVIIGFEALRGKRRAGPGRAI